MRRREFAGSAVPDGRARCGAANSPDEPKMSRWPASENHAPIVSTWWAPSVSAQPVPGSPAEMASITRQNVGRPNA